MPGKRKRGRTEETIQQLPTSNDGNVGSSTGDEGLWVERFDHPLMNDVILETLFVHVKPNDLKTCRLVSKKWSNRILPTARATFHATISGNFPLGSLSPANHRITDFLLLFGSKSSEIPFTKFKLGSFDPTVGLGKELIQLCGESTKRIDLYGTGETQFLENVSALLKSVPKLEYFKMPSTLYSKQANYQELVLHKPREENGFKLFSSSEVPSLKFLTVLEVEREEVEHRQKICPTFYDELLSAAENISTILTSNSILPVCGPGFELLKIFEKLGRESKLKILSLPHVNAEYLELLQRMVAKKDGLKLKHLSVKDGLFARDVLWIQLIDLLKDSLVSLQIHHNFMIPNNLARMPKLKLLDLKFYGINIIGPNFNDFSHSFPALKCLRLSIDESEEGLELDEFYIRSSECCPSMESLTLEYFVLNIRAFERTLIVFPNLKELELNITVYGRNILQKIWTQMTRLEKLKIYGRLSRGNNIESLVTGISADGIKKIKGKKLKTLKGMRMEVRRETISALINEHRTLPSIGDLTNLKYLTLNMTTIGGRYNRHLSDLTGYFGFYSMKNLRHLSISNCKLSKPCSEILVTDMGLESWKFQSSEELEIIPSKWDTDNDCDWDKFPTSKFSFN